MALEYIVVRSCPHINRPLRKIGHLTVPRCLAGGGGIALICVDTYTYFTAVQNILLIGGWICFNSAVSHGLPSCVLVFSCLTSRTLLIFLAIETFRIFYTFSSSISTFSSSFSTFSSSFLTLSSSWFFDFLLIIIFDFFFGNQLLSFVGGFGRFFNFDFYFLYRNWFLG